MHLDWWTIGLQIVNFAILVWLLQHFLYKPVLGMIDARKAEVQKQYDEARSAEEKAKANLAETAKAREGISEERNAALKAAAAEAEDAAAKRHADAEREARSLIAETRKTLAQERERALAEARNAALDLGIAYARRLLSEVPAPLRAEAWLEHVEAHLSGLAQPELAALAGQLNDGAPLTVVAAADLPPETQDVWRKRLGHFFGDGARIAFETDPALIAGTDLHFPTAVLRFSWQNALAAMRAETGGHGDAH